MCSLLDIKKVNTSGLRPLADGLVEKFNLAITNLIAKAGDGSVVEWDEQLPLLLFAYIPLNCTRVNKIHGYLHRVIWKSRGQHMRLNWMIIKLNWMIIKLNLLQCTCLKKAPGTR